MKKKNKLGMMSAVMIAIIVSVVSFFVLLSFFSNVNEKLVSKTDELSCENFLKVKETKLGKISDFFYSVNLKCKKDILDLENNLEKEEIFEKIAERSNSCYSRYGSGELDFMSNFETTGQWCFVCSKISLSEESDNFDFTEFIDWTIDEKEPTEKETYYEKINFKYVDYSEEKILELSKEIENAQLVLNEIKEEVDGIDNTVIDFSLELSKIKKDILDLSVRSFEGGDNVYVVYRYDRFEGGDNLDFQKFTKDVITAAAISGATSAVITTGALALVTGPMAVIAGAANTASKIIKVKKLVSVFSNIIPKLGKLQKFSKVKTILFATGVSTVVGGATMGSVNILSNYNSVQYVDILNEEQYYRHCGTDSVLNE